MALSPNLQSINTRRYCKFLLFVGFTDKLCGFFSFSTAPMLDSPKIPLLQNPNTHPLTILKRSSNITSQSYYLSDCYSYHISYSGIHNVGTRKGKTKKVDLGCKPDADKLRMTKSSNFWHQAPKLPEFHFKQERHLDELSRKYNNHIQGFNSTKLLTIGISDNKLKAN